MSRPRFTVEERERVQGRLVEKGRTDPRIIAGAALGSGALGAGDRWADIDLTFGTAIGVGVQDVLTDWTTDLHREFGAQHLFDLADRATVYRVFLFPGNLQVDLSFTPGAAAQYGPKFRLLFGSEVHHDPSPPPSPRDLFGRAAHHAVRARYCLERDCSWQAEYWIGGVRDEALTLACRRRGLEGVYGRGFDQLPRDVLDLAASALARSVDARELLRALAASIDLLLKESAEVGELAREIAPQLRDLGSSEWS